MISKMVQDLAFYCRLLVMVVPVDVVEVSVVIVDVIDDAVEVEIVDDVGEAVTLVMVDVPEVSVVMVDLLDVTAAERNFKCTLQTN